MLPNFLIIGAQKSATTWLATCLGEHPDVFMYIDETKEIYFFNTLFDKGLAWYESHFENWSGEAAVGEATPGYISHPLAPKRIRDTLGEIKLIASLRHPVDRAYSAFWHMLRRGRLPLNTDFCALFRQGDQFEIRSRGYYAAQLNRYLEYFPRQKLLILLFEEIFNDSQQTLVDCFKFLEVDPRFEPGNLKANINRGRKDISALNSQARLLQGTLWLAARSAMKIGLFPQRLRKPVINTGRSLFHKVAFEWGPKQKQFERLDENIRQELLIDYMPDIRQLEDLLGRDLSIWYQPVSSKGTSPVLGR